MFLKSINYDHSQDNFQDAMSIDQDVMIRSRERIFFSLFANYLQAEELYDDRDTAPAEFTSATGSLQRCLKAISDPVEYELTLLYFMPYSKLATEAFGYYEHLKDLEKNTENSMVNELGSMLKKIMAMSSEDKEDITLNNVSNRINVVKKSNYNFERYMELMGYVQKDYNEVNNLLNGLFN